MDHFRIYHGGYRTSTDCCLQGFRIFGIDATVANNLEFIFCVIALTDLSCVERVLSNFTNQTLLNCMYESFSLGSALAFVCTCFFVLRQAIKDLLLTEGTQCFVKLDHQSRFDSTNRRKNIGCPTLTHSFHM